MINNFIKHFSKKDWNFEFILSNTSKNIDKVLFWSKENNNKYIYDYMVNQNLYKDDKLNNIFKLFKDYNIHIWLDTLTKRMKVYVWLYDKWLEESLKLIKEVKKLLWLESKYFLEKDFYKFDCIWIDISENWLDLKVYELVKKENNYDFLPTFISKENIKELWYLKNVNWRKKKFFRLLNKVNINNFKDDFDLSELEKLKSEIKDFYNLEKKVKYFCIEWEKQEIYFV